MPRRTVQGPPPSWLKVVCPDCGKTRYIRKPQFEASTHFRCKKCAYRVTLARLRQTSLGGGSPG
jgi:transposase-like protein